MMLNVWLFLFVLSALLDWSALWWGWTRVNYVSKPATLLALIAWFTSLGGWQIAPFWFGLALVFSLLGDVFLLLGEKYFLMGLVAFLLAHVGYVLGFIPPSAPASLPTLAIAIPVLLLGSCLYHRLCTALVHDPGLKKMNLPLLLYSLALCLMLFSAVLTFVQVKWLPAAAALVTAGGMLFFTSDYLLAHNRFIAPFSNAQLLVRITYHLAQLALVSGILLNYLNR